MLEYGIGQSGIWMVRQAHHERGLASLTAHPELVEGTGGWFDRLTMNGRMVRQAHHERGVATPAHYKQEIHKLNMNGGLRP